MKGLSGIEANVRPASLVERALAAGRSAFIERFADTLLLLVRLDEGGADLQAGLEKADATTAKPSDGERALAYTEAFGRRAEIAREAARRRSPPSFDHHMLRGLLERGLQFVVPLRKRPLIARLTDRISVGRSRSNDIVLRHGSVSKLHAWLECDYDRTFFLSDAQSKNATRVNGVLIDSSALVMLRAGDEVRFGQVETTVCEAGMLWDALAGRL